MNSKIVRFLSGKLNLPGKHALVSYFAEIARGHDSKVRDAYNPYAVLRSLNVPLVLREIVDEGFTARVSDLIAQDRRLGVATEKCVLTRQTDNTLAVVVRRATSRTSAADEKRRRFTVAHEMAHVLIRSFIQKSDPSFVLPYEDTGEEDLCNAIAAEFLVPSAELSAHINSAGIHCDILDRLSNQYDVSITFLIRRAMAIFPSGPYVAALYEDVGGDTFCANYVTPTDHRWLAHSNHAYQMSVAVRECKKAEPLGRILDLQIAGRRANWYCESMKLSSKRWWLVLFGEVDKVPFNQKFIGERCAHELAGAEVSEVESKFQTRHFAPAFPMGREGICPPVPFVFRRRWRAS